MRRCTGSALASGSCPTRCGTGASRLRNWCKQSDIDTGRTPGVTTSEAGGLKKLRQEVKELKRANEILLAASSFFAGARPATALVVEFIDEHRDRFGVEPICRVLREHGVGIAPNTYRAAKTRPPSARSISDAEWLEEIRRVHGDRQAERRWASARSRSPTA